MPSINNEFCPPPYYINERTITQCHLRHRIRNQRQLALITPPRRHLALLQWCKFHCIGDFTMNQIPLIDRIVAEVSSRMPSGLGDLRQDVERNLQAVLQEALTRFDLVSREEFEVQRLSRLRTRVYLELLDRIVPELVPPQRLAVAHLAIRFNPRSFLCFTCSI